MKYVVRYFLVIAFVVALVGSVATAQDLQEQLAKLGHDAAVGYISPILSGWGNDLNSAIYYSADLHDVLGFDVGVKLAMSKFTDADKTYDLTLPASMKVTTIPGLPAGVIPAGGYIILTSGVNYTSSVIANSAVGAKDEVDVKTLGGRAHVYNAAGTDLGQTPVGVIPVGQTILPLPGGFDIGKLGVPLPMPQADLGLPFGLEVMLRYIPTIKTGDVGKFNYMGFGLRYSISQWLPLFPVDIAAHFMTQKMNFKSTTDQDIFTAKGTAYGLEVSKKLFILTLYTGFQLESSTLTLADFQGYDPALGQTVTIPGFEVKGSDKSRFTVGARLLLLIINVHVEYSVAKNPVRAAGVGITIR
jgi:hypothetical protein